MFGMCLLLVVTIVCQSYYIVTLLDDKQLGAGSAVARCIFLSLVELMFYERKLLSLSPANSVNVSGRLLQLIKGLFVPG